MNTWQRYVKDVTDGATQVAIAEQTGIAQSSISHWLNGVKSPTEAAQVAKFAQTYGRNVLEAFVAASMVTIDQARRGITDAEAEFLASILSPQTPSNVSALGAKKARKVGVQQKTAARKNDKRES